MSEVYLDHAAASKVDKNLALKLAKISSDFYGNPSSFNLKGRQARSVLDSSRLSIARFLKVKSEEIIFTSSGSESNNLAILGLINENLSKDRTEILVNPTEHPSVLKTLDFVKTKGFKTVFLKVDKEGFIDLDDLQKKVTKKTLLVSVMYANNEIGTIQMIKRISDIIKVFKTKNKTGYPLFHSDACQATGYLNMNLSSLGPDLVTINSSKIGGPKGVAALYVKKSVKIRPILYGGEQEFGLRPGTENLPAIYGFAEALKTINKTDKDRIVKLRDYFIDILLKNFKNLKLNGPIGNSRLSNNINVSFPELESEIILAELDKYRISAGSGSACTSRSIEPSHVLLAIGVKKPHLSGAIRFSLGSDTTRNDIDYTIKTLKRIIPELARRYKNLG